MTTKHIPGQQGLAPGIEGNTALLFGRVGAGSADMLGGLKELRRDNLQVQQHLGSTIAAAKYAGIGEVTDVSLAEQKMSPEGGVLIGTADGYYERKALPGELTGVTVRGLCCRRGGAVQRAGEQCEGQQHLFPL